MAEVLSGQITVTTAGTAQAGPATPVGETFAIKAHPDNSAPAWVGNDGEDDVSDADGFPLEPGEGIVVNVRSLDALRFDVGADGETLCWFKVR